MKDVFELFIVYSLPYTEASLREILRFETVTPSSVAHRVTEDTTLNGLYFVVFLKILKLKTIIFTGYDIPKDTFALPSLIALNNDKLLWKDPENFRPERFLNFKGNLSLKKDISLPFSAGRRLCAAETFSRNTMFLCVTALLQNFNLKPLGNILPDLNDNYCGLIRAPKDFWVHFEAR